LLLYVQSPIGVWIVEFLVSCYSNLWIERERTN